MVHHPICALEHLVAIAAIHSDERVGNVSDQECERGCPTVATGKK